MLLFQFLTVPLFGDLIWIPGKFLAEQIGTKSNDLSIKFFGHGSLLEKRLEQIEANSAKDVKSFSLLVCFFFV